MGALDDIVVVEAGEGYGVSYCGKLFADLGARVIKLEPPGTGDPLRRHPPFADGATSEDPGLVFRWLNVNKQSVTLDYRSDEGQRLLRRLLEQADVFVTGEPEDPAVQSRLDRLREELPRLVVAAVTPFGVDSPYAGWAATEIVTFNMGGLGYISPMASGRPEAPPLKAAGRQSELQAGILAAVAALAALQSREQDGQGALVDVAAQEAIIIVQEENTTRYSYQGTIRNRAAPWIHQPVGLYPCQDGHIFIFCLGVLPWERLVEVMGTPEWTTLEVFADGPSRALNFDALYSLLSEWTLQFDKVSLYRLLQQHHVPSAIVNTMADLVAAEQLQAREFWTAAPGEPEDRRFPGAPYRLSATPWALRTPAPGPGEQTEAVLGDLGLDAATIAGLRERRVV